MRTERYREEFERAIPRIRLHATVYFRAVRCPHRKADYIAEALGLSWKWWIRLRQRGKDPNRFVSAIASYAAKAARCGRRVVGHEKAQDVLSPVAQQRHSFYVGKLPDVSTLSDNPLVEALADNTVTPPDEQAAFRCDFPCWVRTYDQRRRDILGKMMVGERTRDIAEHFGVSDGRISQMRSDFHFDWLLFIGD